MGQQTINFSILFKLMSRKIDDKLLFSLLKKKFKNNTCNFKDFKILTPILINVYLHHLDLELEKLKKNYNLFFKKLFYFSFNLKTLRKTSFRTLNLIKYGRILTHKTLYCPFKTKIKNQNSNFKRFKIRYVRYLNFFLIGIIGDYEKNYQKINRYTLTFCNSNLKLLLAYKNPIKVSSKIVINFLNFKINFLEFNKFLSYSKKSFKILKQKNLLLTTFSNCFFILKKKQLKKRKSYLKVLTLNKYNHLSNLKQFKNKKKNLITFKAPLYLVLNNFKQNEILSSKKKTKFVTWLTHYSNYLIVKWFKKKSKFLLNLYCCCDNFKKIKIFVDRILRYCAIKTLAIKNKLTIQKTIKNWSKNIIIKDKTNKFILIKYLTKLEIQKI